MMISTPTPDFRHESRVVIIFPCKKTLVAHDTSPVKQPQGFSTCVFLSLNSHELVHVRL